MNLIPTNFLRINRNNMKHKNDTASIFLLFRNVTCSNSRTLTGCFYSVHFSWKFCNACPGFKPEQFGIDRLFLSSVYLSFISLKHLPLPQHNSNTIFEPKLMSSIKLVDKITHLYSWNSKYTYVYVSSS